MRILRSFAFVALLAICSACATLPPRISITSFGDANVTNDAKLADQANDIIPVPGEPRVVVGMLPEGLVLSESGSKLSIEPGYESRYSVIGSTDITFPIDGYTGLKNAFWTWPYLENWRRTYCPFQIPFKIVTLSLWNYTPFGAPCMAVMPSDESERKALLMDSAKKAAQVMGGNLVIVSATGDLQVTTVSQYSSAVSNFRYTRLVAFVLKESGAK